MGGIGVLSIIFDSKKMASSKSRPNLILQDNKEVKNDLL
jgi:hypothetical protein